ncbi:MAG: hypothetical protein J7576_03480 [Siphonobacter aquaeclarae]|nr:hypothetical protein [Siphonobacter aquaeclarae]
MRKYALLSGLLLVASLVHAQSDFFIKVGAGLSIPYGKFEDAETQDLAKLVRTGPNIGLTIGHDFGRHWGLALTGAIWQHAVRNERMTEYLKEQYLPAAYQPYVKSLGTSSNNFRFVTGYLSPYYAFYLGERLRVDIRLNGGIMYMQFPVIRGDGTATSPLDGKDYPLSVVTAESSAASFTYGAGGSLTYHVTGAFRVFADVDGLRSHPKFDDISVKGSLGPVTLDTVRPGFTQTAGTLSIRFGAGFFF